MESYLERTLPTSQETGLGESTTKRVDERVQSVLDGGEKRAKKPRKE